jgi:hypothetical protein
METSMPEKSASKRNAKRKIPGSNSIPAWGLIPIFALVFSIFGIYLKLRPANSKPDPPEIVVKTPEPAPIIEKPIVPVTQPREKSNAELILDAYPDDSSDLSKTYREIASLALRKDLWIHDFKKLIELSRIEVPFTVSSTFLEIFGKPDSESVYTQQRQTPLMAAMRTSVAVSIKEYTYLSRLKNPTTGKNENLTVVFADSLLDSVSSQSGHELMR